MSTSPLFSVKADGQYIWDVDNNKYIDWPMALGPLVLGHNFKKLNKILKSQLDKGVAFSLPNKLEVTVSEQLINWFKCFDAIRFGKMDQMLLLQQCEQLEQLLQEIIYYVAGIMDGKTGFMKQYYEINGCT